MTTSTPKNILVIGGAGYIGCGLVRDLLARGFRVRALDSLLFGDEPLRPLIDDPHFELVRGDFRQVEAVVRAVRDMDAVIHLGGIVGDPACAVNEDETLEINLSATRLLAGVSRAMGVSRFLFASSCSVYGATEETVDETSSLNPVSLYAATKADSEKVLLAARDETFHPVILRLGTAFGWSCRPRFDLVVNLLVAKALAERKIVIYNGEQWRPFVHVRDIARAFRLALEAPPEQVSGEIFNVGDDGMNFTLRQVAERMAALEPGLVVEHLDNADRRNYRVSFAKIRERLGFERQVSLEQGIEGLERALRSRLVIDYRAPRFSNLAHRLAEQTAGHKPGDGSVALSALHFARNSLWWRATGGNGKSHLLLSNGLISMALAPKAIDSQDSIREVP